MLDTALLTFSVDGFSIRTFDPVPYWTLRTFEELGMPLLHASEESDSYPQDEWFVTCPAGSIDTSCNSNTALNVDFWLFDSRSFPIVDSPEFKSIFPDQAILRNQYSYWARNDGPISYKSISRMLKELNQQFRSAELLYSKGQCRKVDPTSPAHTQVQSAGLAGGEYACYDSAYLQREYLTCPNFGSSSGVTVLSVVAVAVSVVLVMW